ncbi:hypothetical protein C8A03DRAFT_14440 [Achaetomium macrosporum]|uniref:Fucose-specific lectin n=1 Tax=Achaetomium macrosporum TaxID=79813 RepID=A0AAN7CBW4_9PEZI|nr:hypothetical protein C8A03DRAFT_14440 [Achaetomium macrosporum]
MARLLSGLLLLGAAVSPACAAIAAWWTEIGPQIILQNQTTSQIRYSACNVNDQPRYSYSDSRFFSLSHSPKNGTPLAGAGWWNQLNTTASIFYIDNNNNIVNAFFYCDMATGLFEQTGEWVIGGDVPSIHTNSGLATVLLGDEAGYRVYFHDDDGAINELGYTPNENAWRYHGVISQDINALPALAAAFSGSNNITVVSPRDAQNLGATRLNRDDTWYRTTLPHPLQGNFSLAVTNRSDIAINETAVANFSLPAWDGKTKGIGISIDSAYTRYVWYIGSDGFLYSVADQNFTWGPRDNQSSAFWPKADEPNAELAVAYDFKSSMVRIYYLVRGQLSEIKFQDRVWKAWATVPEPTTPAIVSSTPSATSSPDASSADGGLAPGAKAGIGVGVSLGAIALGAIIAVIVLARRKKQQGFEQSPYPEEGSTTLGPDTPSQSYGSPALALASAGQYEWDDKTPTPVTAPPNEPQHIHQLDGRNAPTEMYAPEPMYELPIQPYSHELPAEPPQPRQ